ncbi:MAG: GIY-YIG nuclease family protein [Clostridiales Family XIII bacterium]|jgi:putative endonuclease|nr:GIY-YIG nuclease family protein [Clostridiales Family XIII bacterium]
MEKKNNDSICVYILECSDNTLYTGWTNDIENRIKAHNAGTGAKYTKGRTPVKLVYTESADSRNQALKREAAIKRLSKKKKLALISGETAGRNRAV